jgi:hypothetical protein
MAHTIPSSTVSCDPTQRSREEQAANLEFGEHTCTSPDLSCGSPMASTGLDPEYLWSSSSHLSCSTSLQFSHPLFPQGNNRAEGSNPTSGMSVSPMPTAWPALSICVPNGEADTDTQWIGDWTAAVAGSSPLSLSELPFPHLSPHNPGVLVEATPGPRSPYTTLPTSCAPLSPSRFAPACPHPSLTPRVRRNFRIVRNGDGQSTTRYCHQCKHEARPSSPLLPCGHPTCTVKFCLSCLDKYRARTIEGRCPLCEDVCICLRCRRNKWKRHAKLQAAMAVAAAADATWQGWSRLGRKNTDRAGV